MKNKYNNSADDCPCLKPEVMYILILEDVPLGNAMAATAHASLAAYLKFKDDPETVSWLKGSFKKVVCKVTQKEFDRNRDEPDKVIITESSMEGREVAMAFKPSSCCPKRFSFYRLYGKSVSGDAGHRSITSGG